MLLAAFLKLTGFSPRSKLKFDSSALFGTLPSAPLSPCASTKKTVASNLRHFKTADRLSV